MGIYSPSASEPLKDLHLPLLECVQWEGGQLGGGLETH